MDKKAEFGERLRAAITQAGHPLRPVMVERAFNTRYWGRPVTVQAVRRWLRGEAIPSQEKLLVLADWLKIAPHTLRFGEEIGERIAKSKSEWNEAIGFQERETFEAFLQLPAPQRKIVREVILAFTRAFPPDPPALDTEKPR